MAILKKFSRLTGFTETEIKVILFLLIALVTGSTINYFKQKTKNKNLLQFDYSEQDSMFYSAENKQVERDSVKKIIEKEVDSKRELLDFNDAKNVKKNTIDSDFIGEYVNINSADKDQLTKLPGIGEKTAERIIAFRKSNGKFSSAEDIMNVKGIGETKFKNLKKYIIVK